MLLSTSKRQRSSSPLVLVLLLLLSCWVVQDVVCSEATTAEVPVTSQPEDVVDSSADEPLSASQDDDGKVTDTDSHPATNTNTNSNENSNHHPAEETHNNCAWGTPCHPEFNGTDQESASEQKESNRAAENASNTAGNSGNIPFVHHHHPAGNLHNHIHPPEGFTIAARVYTDPNDKLAHFTDDTEGEHITLPYWECGATGSTTTPLPVKHAYFRHALSGSKPQVWSGTEYGPHPQLIVALKRMELILNSGETKHLKPGEVVLLEDVVSGGHKIKALDGDFDMTYLVLTLPQHYHHVGRDRMALKKNTMEKKYNPCANDIPSDQQKPKSGGAFLHQQAPPLQQPKKESTLSFEALLSGHTVPDQRGEVAPFKEGKMRKLLLGAVGISVTSLFADFLGRVAPLWLAVGIGGTCFVAGGTYGIVQCGDYLWTELEMWQEKKRLEMPIVMGDAAADSATNRGKDEEHRFPGEKEKADGDVKSKTKTKPVATVTAPP